MRALTLVFALLLVAPAAAEETTRDAPWQLTGISANGRTLRIVYEVSGCLHDDGTPVVDESAPDAVRITVRQTVDTGPYVVCALFLAYHPLDVPLATPLAGRRVAGGPDLAAASLRPERMPRVIGLRRADARRALERQDIATRVLGRAGGVIRAQSPEPGRTLPSGRLRATLLSGPFDARARLAVSIPAGQTIGSLLRRGLRLRYSVAPTAEPVLLVRVACAGADGGNESFATRARGRARVPIANGDLRRSLRHRAAVTCKLTAATYRRGEDEGSQYLVLRRASVQLHR